MTELFEIELFICIKVDLGLNNQQKLICYKNQPTNQPITTTTTNNNNNYRNDNKNAVEDVEKKYSHVKM